MVYGFDLSEQFGIPVILRTSTRVSHMRGIVECGRQEKPKSTTKETESDGHWLRGYFVKNPREFVPVPALYLFLQMLLQCMKDLQKKWKEWKRQLMNVQ